MEDRKILIKNVPEDLSGQRLDQVLPVLFPDFSRSKLQQWLKEEQILVDKKHWKQRDRVYGNEEVELTVELLPDESWVAQEIPLEIIYEDDDLLVINKPAGLVVHPGAGNRDGTLLNGLLAYDPQQATLPRAGIVHRIDKDTSGLLVVARSLLAHKTLVAGLKDKLIKRDYQAIVQGVMTGGGTVDAAIGRHPKHRTRMAVVQRGREAVTHYRVIKRFRSHTHIRVSLETGRTHQIRVHMAHISHPLLGDPVYSGRLKLPPAASDHFIMQLRSFKRQALHACSLSLEHPRSGEMLSWESPLPDDFNEILSALKLDQQEHAD